MVSLDIRLSGDGYSNGYGYGFGDGYGAGIPNDEPTLRAFWAECAKAGNYGAQECLRETNQEVKRTMIECLGADVFFAQAKATVVHQDTDGIGNPRKLLRVPMPETRRGFIQAVEVICPTTGRHYFLGVQPTVKDCQSAVASTFGLKPEEYVLERES